MVLIVDDEENDVLLLQRALRKSGVRYSTHVLANGDEAIHYLNGDAPFDDRARYPVPALMLLDLKMPGTSGFDVLAWLRRAHPELHRLPVIVFTSSRLLEDVDHAYECGANSYIVKSCGNYDAIGEILKKFTNLNSN